MSGIPNPYKEEANGFYLGKNRRLADIIFVPEFGDKEQVKDLSELALLATDEARRQKPGECTIAFMESYGWGRTRRYPPGGPTVVQADYERNLQAMTSDVLQLWKKLKEFTCNHEDNLQRWVVSAAAMDQKAALKDVLKSSWRETVQSFNHCDPLIKSFMEPKYSESDFYLGNTEITERHGEAFFFFNRNFMKTDVEDLDKMKMFPPSIYRHLAGFWDIRTGWPRHDEPNPIYYKDIKTCYNVQSREYYLDKRAQFLVPQINLEDLTQKANLLTFLHFRARLHPCVFVRMDHDLTYLGRRTAYLSGPFLPGYMFSFETSRPGSSNSIEYFPKKWTGWSGVPWSSPKTDLDPEFLDAYDRKFYQGHLFGSAEAWVIIQHQRVVYNFLWHFAQNVSQRIGLSALTNMRPRTDLERRKIRKKCLGHLKMFKAERSDTWRKLLRMRQYSLPPTKISSDYYRYIQARQGRAEEHLRQLFEDPEYFYNAIAQMKEHHWANIGVKKNEEDPMEVDMNARYIEEYTDQETRHLLYYDLIRAVLRRAIFESFMWKTLSKRLERFEQYLKSLETGYGSIQRPEDDETTWMMNHPPPIPLNAKDKKVMTDVQFQYYNVVALVRYYAMFFMNEFRKKGIHAGSEPMRNLAYGIGPVQEDVINQRPCPIAKGHYYGPDLKYESKLKKPDMYKDTETRKNLKLFVFDAIDSFIANPLDSNNCGIREVTNCLDVIINVLNDEQFSKTFTSLVVETIQSLDILADLADHLEMLWPSLLILGRIPESDREYLFKTGQKPDSIEFLHFDQFDFDDRVPKKRLKRIFQFFDEQQGFKADTISLGFARCDLKRLGASLLAKVIIPKNTEAMEYAAPDAALQELEDLMKVKRSEYEFKPSEVPANLDKEGKEEDFIPVIYPQSRTHRTRAAAERALRRERKERRDTYYETVGNALAQPSKEDIAREKKRIKKLNRRRAKNKARTGGTEQDPAASSPISPSPGESSNDVEAPEEKDEDAALSIPNPNDPEYMESTHVNIKHFDLPSDAETESFQESEPGGEQKEDEDDDNEDEGEGEGEDDMMEVDDADPSEDDQDEPDILKVSNVLAPDGLPKLELRKRVWETLESIYGRYGTDSAAVSYADLTKALAALGYKEQGRGGSHNEFMRQPSCRWPHEALPKGNSFTVARNHDGSHSVAAKGKARDWGKRFEQKGMTLQFIEDWCAWPRRLSYVGLV